MRFTLIGNKRTGFAATGDSTAADRKKLKPCPFCGFGDELEIMSTTTPRYWVECIVCRAKKRPVEMVPWNERPFKTAAECLKTHRHAVQLAIDSWNERNGKL